MQPRSVLECPSLELSALKVSSHEIVQDEGVLSRTRACVLSQVAYGKPNLSDAVMQAKVLGCTELDPRDDLNGMDGCSQNGGDSWPFGWIDWRCAGTN
jgi:homoserine dehydrogenase